MTMDQARDTPIAVYSSMGDLFSFSHHTDRNLSTAPGDRCDDSYLNGYFTAHELHLIWTLKLILLNTICLVGVVANGVNVRVLYQIYRDSKSGMYLILLLNAVCDVGVCVGYLVIAFDACPIVCVFRHAPNPVRLREIIYVRIVAPIANVFESCSVYLYVLVTVLRFRQLRQVNDYVAPQSSDRAVSVARSSAGSSQFSGPDPYIRIAIAAMFALAVVANSTFFFCLSLTCVGARSKLHVDARCTSHLVQWSTAVAARLLPLTLLIVFSGLVLTAIYETFRRLSADTKLAPQSTQRRITTMILLIDLLYVIGQIPTVIMIAAPNTFYSRSAGWEERFVTVQIVNVLSVLSYTPNVIVMATLDTRHRTVIKKMFSRSRLDAESSS